jgi:carbonic anhydrase
MRFLPQLFENNRQWASRQIERDPAFFERLCAIQQPEYVWIGCADSRVPANEIVGLAPGELFVHRNVANLILPDDQNCLAVLDYAVNTLKVPHIIVCGHYHCGGVRAAFDPPGSGRVDGWIAPIRAMRDRYRAELDLLEDENARWHRLCELNVISQVEILKRLPVIIDTWQQGRPLDIHGWIYDLRDGLLRDLNVTSNGSKHSPY